MSSRKKGKPQMVIKETLFRTKGFFHKNLRNAKSFILRGYQKLPKIPTINPIFSSSRMINNTKMDNHYGNFSAKWDSIEVVNKKEGHLSPKVQRKDEEQRSKSSMSVADFSGLEDLKEEKKKKTSNSSGGKEKEYSLMAADALAQKMKELEMMDVKDMDHVLDIEEVLHYYSRLTCPSYVEIVDNFFMDMYSEFQVEQPLRSVNNSMRKLGSVSVSGSMRSLGPIKLRQLK